jgi:hypothetical protein
MANGKYSGKFGIKNHPGNMRSVLILYVFAFLTLSAFSQPGGRLLNIPYGKYAVGLSQKKVSYNDSVEVLITTWQPVINSLETEKLSIRDCIAIELPGIVKADSIANDLISGSNYKINADSLTGFLNAKTTTFKQAQPVNKKFPVLAWAYRHGTSHYQFAICEYLASHGYIVFNASRANPSLPLPWEVDIKDRMNLLQLHMNDMNPMFDFIKSHPQADTSKIALLSWSYGASSAVFTQQSHPEIDVVLGFSSINFRNDFFTHQHFESLLRPEKLIRPYILFCESVSRLGRVFNDSVFHPAHKNISRLYRFPKMLHGNFNYLEGHVLGKLNLPLGHPWSKPGLDAVVGYETVCQLALLILDHYLKDLSREKLESEIHRIKQKLPDGFFF